MAARGTGRAGHRWAALLGGITIASVLVSAYALAHKTFPGQGLFIFGDYQEDNQLQAALRAVLE